MFKTEQRVKYIYANVKLSDGRRLDGKFIIAETSDLLMNLNGDGKFAVFVSHEGETKLIAKTSIVEANEKVIKKIKPLSSSNDNGFDPYKILGVDSETTFSVIKTQYQKLRRQYLPDRYIHEEMPAEIAKYARDMSQQIEQAFLALSANQPTCDQKLAG